jgi:large subunit ribosomal protein L13
MMMATSIKPYRTRASELKPDWHVIDAEGRTLGRLCTEIAVLLQGKHKPIYVPYLNTGDYVIVVNAEKIHVTGKKLEQKIYYRHSGYHGGLKEETLAKVLAKTPTRVIKRAVKGMLPKNSLGRHMLSRLKVYAGGEHPHQAQVNAGERASAAGASTEVEQDAEEA